MKLQTPFYNKHLEYGCQWQEAGFAWYCPAVYTSAEQECRMVRERVSFVDYSFQFTFAITGRDAFGFLQKLLVNDLNKIFPGKAIYSTMLDKTGKVVDDIILFWVEENSFIMVGVKKQPAYEWLKKNVTGLDAYITELGNGLLSLQGPKSRDVLQKAVNIKDLSYFSIIQDKIDDIPVLIAQVGFTGELGYELYISPAYANILWDTIMELGKDHNVGPYGLAAASSLAIEKGYLSATDFYEGSTPLEVNLGWTVRFDKEDFIGKDALLRRRSEGLKTKLVGFEVSEPKVVASIGDNLLREGRVVGQVTRAAYGYTIGKSIGRGWVEIAYAKEGEELEVEHEKKRINIKLVRPKWYDPEGKKVRA